MATKQDIKNLYSDPGKKLSPASWRRMIDFLSSGITTVKNTIVNAVTPRATPQQVTHAHNVDAYMSPLALKSLKVVCLNTEFGTEPEYLFETGIMYEKIIDDLIIEP